MEIEITPNEAKVLVEIATVEAFEQSRKGRHGTAMDTISSAQKLLPALGEFEDEYTEQLDWYYGLYQKKQERYTAANTWSLL